VGNTLGAYGLTLANFCFVAILYGVMSKYFGWWLPYNPLVNPNILATPFPWISALSAPLKAGLWEEAAFRAIPIASAALVGQYFGKRKQFIVAAVILQAIIFGGLHANYPTQPAYARLVEIIIPALLFGWVFIRFGLILSIISHFLFNWVWFSLPIFVSLSSGVTFTHLMTLLVGLLPILDVLLQRKREGKWNAFLPEQLNRAFKPRVLKMEKKMPPKKSVKYSAKIKVPLVMLAIGLVLLIPKYGLLKSDGSTQKINRKEAVVLAKNYLSKQNLRLDNSWKIGAIMASKKEISHRFIWESGGEKSYKSLMPQYFQSPHFVVTFKKKQGSLEEKLEKYSVYLNAEGDVVKMNHILPDSREGPKIGETLAKKMAIVAVKKWGPLKTNEFELISFESIQKPNRSDWHFVFKDLRTKMPPQGETRISVSIAGDEISSMTPFIYIQQDWLRNLQNTQYLKFLTQEIFHFLWMLAFAVGLGWAFFQWVRKQFSLPIFKALFGLLLCLQLGYFLNAFTRILAVFSTQQSNLYQTFFSFGTQLISWVFIAGSVATILGAVLPKLIKRSTFKKETFLIEGLAIATISFALKLGLSSFDKKMGPIFGNFYTDHLFPILSPIFKWQIEIIAAMAFGFLIIYGNSWVIEKFQKGKVWTLLIFLGMGVAIQSLMGFESWHYWWVSSLFIGLLLYGLFLFVFRRVPKLWLFWVGGMMSASSLQYALFFPDNSAWIAAILNGVLSWGVILFVFFKFNKPRSN